MCNIRQENDEMVCHDCGTRWDTHEEQPVCNMKELINDGKLSQPKYNTFNYEDTYKNYEEDMPTIEDHDINFSAAAIAKAAGFKSLQEVVRLTGVTRSKLEKMATKSPNDLSVVIDAARYRRSGSINIELLHRITKALEAEGLEIKDIAR